MGLFDWDEKLSVGNEEIDTHHKKLIQLFNEVGTLIDAKEETPLYSTIKVLSELNLYTIFHFRKEEKLMEAAHYPLLEEHKKLHDNFIKKVQELKDNYIENDPLINYEMYNYLSEWIIHHIMQVDSKYRDYI